MVLAKKPQTKNYITASKLYNYIQCPHRVWRDIYGPQEERNPEPNPFVKLLWERGILHEKEVVKTIGEFADLSIGTHDERYEQTIKHMQAGTPLIYQGVLRYDDLLGIPDLLRKLPDGSYKPIDIKSGRAFEGIEDESKEARQKKHYAVQLCLYVDVLVKNGFSSTESPCAVIDANCDEVEYLLNQPMSKTAKLTWWDFYGQAQEKVRALIDNRLMDKPAKAAVCKLCHWYESCGKWCEETDDLTNVFYLGRNRRDVMNADLGIDTVGQILELNVEKVLLRKKTEKSFMRGIGEAMLTKYCNRAGILSSTKSPVIYQTVDFPKVAIEVFYDVEDDPTREHIYLHGVYERKNGKEQYISFIAEDKVDEKRAWAGFWDYIRSLPAGNFAVYYYSPYEKTINRRLRELYPDVISEEELQAFFESDFAVDLYLDVVFKHTDWPLSSYSIKHIATYLGFSWRDETPSGALSIQWYNEYLKSGDKSILKRILEYNEDDCKATMVLKDGIENLCK